ncbi:MAG: hypothetical protein U5L06_08760 [Rhodovibrio sp.]|nr:hypothetical protein [Rhodovibrio sp.]
MAEGDGAEINAHVGDVTTSAGNGGDARTDIGVSSGGDVDAYVGGDVTTRSSGGSAETSIGTTNRSDVDAGVGGDVYTDAGRGNASTRIGTGKDAFVGGDVINLGGDLSVRRRLAWPSATVVAASRSTAVSA